MKTRLSFLVAVLLVTMQSVASSMGERQWHVGQVREIQREPRAERSGGDHWEYVILSDALLYTLKNGPNDSPYLNSSLGAQVKIASLRGSDKPYDGDGVFVLDVNGGEHRMDLVSVVVVAKSEDAVQSALSDSVSLHVLSCAGSH